MIKKGIIKTSIFLVILMLINFMLTPIFTVKIEHRRKLYQGLYENTGNAYDVVLLGSSHMHSAINPNILWSQYGITSFNYATGGQPIDITYYLLKEILKNHDHPIVVVDLYYLGLTRKFGDEGYDRYVLDNMKLSKNKVEAILNCTPRPHWISYIFPIVKYHSRWKELKKEDFNFDTSKNYYTKGFDAGNKLYGKDSLGDSSITGMAELPPKSEEYLYKIIDLAKKEGVKLVFINSPYDYASTNRLNYWHKEPVKMFNKVEKIAKENNITFINYCDKFDELGFDFKSDMYNVGHMNMKGSIKITNHLADLLKKQYNLLDNRNNKKYTKWNTEYEYYLHKEGSSMLIKK